MLMGRRSKGPQEPKAPDMKRSFEAIARDETGSSERYCVNNVTSIEEAREELQFQVRNLKTILVRVKP